MRRTRAISMDRREKRSRSLFAPAARPGYRSRSLIFPWWRGWLIMDAGQSKRGWKWWTRPASRDWTSPSTCTPECLAPPISAPSCRPGRSRAASRRSKLVCARPQFAPRCERTQASSSLWREATGGGSSFSIAGGSRRSPGEALPRLLSREGSDPVDTVYDILLGEIDDLHGLMVIAHAYDPEDLRSVFLHPLCMVGSDATALALDGPLAGKSFHGAFTWAAWFFRHFVTNTKQMTAEQAVHRLDRPARRHD